MPNDAGHRDSSFKRLARRPLALPLGGVGVAVVATAGTLAGCANSRLAWCWTMSESSTPSAMRRSSGLNSRRASNLSLSASSGPRSSLSNLRRPFQREPDFGVTSVNYDFADLLARAEPPR